MVNPLLLDPVQPHACTSQTAIRKVAFCGPLSTRSATARVQASRRCQCRAATLEDLQVAADKYVWRGHDEFDSLNDRQDAKPLSLPPVKTPKRIVLVRHGQSTWNAEGRVQGSCNISVLTDKG